MFELTEEEKRAYEKHKNEIRAFIQEYVGRKNSRMPNLNLHEVFQMD